MSLSPEPFRASGVGQVTMSGREYLVAVSPVGNGLVMEILRYPNEYFNDLPRGKADTEMAALATELINRKAADFKRQVAPIPTMPWL